MYFTSERIGSFVRIGEPSGVFAYLIEGEHHAALIDTGFGYANLSAYVRTLTEKPLYIINTHGHFDHVGGNAHFAETCYMHEKDFPLCREHCTRDMRTENAKRAETQQNYETGEFFNALPADFDAESYATLGTGELRAVADGDVFDLGGATLRIIETPGHTKGGISVLYEEANIVLIGDATGFFVWLFAPETTGREEYIAGLDRLLATNADAFWGGHNPAPMSLEDIRHYRRAAAEADYSKGQPFDSFYSGDAQPRLCALDGKTIEQMFEPGFAAIIISEDK